ncbi:hypothetical protein HYH03_011318 [Edaphochlamys debaryana]|uniref:Uncharacterized protein n=1 Tax=Edaphochlamys debaryana TaxID=47281 RepID=A0A835XXG9_9CHLO|nr:hypothetical protein HYH03_011318 [Edaphochlamys debaryana]|eukprot:KAG2490191.1 hypothetical protein HYH03_011318 [Edaphochlamys debaryana]
MQCHQQPRCSLSSRAPRASARPRRFGLPVVTGRPDVTARAFANGPQQPGAAPQQQAYPAPAQQRQAPPQQPQQPPVPAQQGMYYGTPAPPLPQQQPPYAPPLQQQWYQGTPRPAQQPQQPPPGPAYGAPYASPSAPQPGTSYPGYPPQQPLQQQAYAQPGYGAAPSLPPRAPGAGAAVVPAVNPGRNAVNAVTLLGTVMMPNRDRRSCVATLSVPFASKAGAQEFLLEAWDEAADALETLHGVEVLADGRLAVDHNNNVKVVAYAFKRVDRTLPVSGYSSRYPLRSGAGGGAGAGGDGAAGEAERRAKLSAEAVWEAHYEQQPTPTIEALSRRFLVKPGTVLEALLEHAYKTKSPLRWHALAQEYGLSTSPEDGRVQLMDCMFLAAQYIDAAGPDMPKTQGDMPKVKPMKDWAEGLPPERPEHYTITAYKEAVQDSLDKTYSMLRMAVVAEATKGSWSYESEFPGYPQ